MIKPNEFFSLARKVRRDDDVYSENNSDDNDHDYVDEIIRERNNEWTILSKQIVGTEKY